MTILTNAQADFLTRAMHRPITAYAGDMRVSKTLMGRSFVQCMGKDSLCHAPLYQPTMAGLQALRDFRAKRWAKCGCVAYLQDLQAVERAITAQAA